MPPWSRRKRNAAAGLAGVFRRAAMASSARQRLESRLPDRRHRTPPQEARIPVLIPTQSDRHRKNPAMTRDTELAALKARLQEIDDLRGAAALLHWDQSTYMPPGGAESRGRQLALLSRLAPRPAVRSGDRTPARFARALGRGAGRRFGRGRARPRHAPRLRTRDARAVRVHRTAERAHHGHLPRVGARATGQRFRRRAPDAREDRRVEPRARGVPPRLRASLRRAHRSRRGRHDGGGRADALRRVARRARAADRGHSLAPGGRRQLPRRRFSRRARSRRSAKR